MKYLFLIVWMLSAFAFAQEGSVVLKSGEYKLKTGGEYLVNPCPNSTKCLSFDAAIKAQNALIKSCKCRVDIYPPTIQGTWVVPTSSSSSSKASSSSAPPTSVSSASSSSIAAQERVTLQWEAPVLRKNGQVFNPETELAGYLLDLGTGTLIELSPTGLKMAHIVDAPKTGQVYKIAAKDKDGLISDYEPFI